MQFKEDLKTNLIPRVKVMAEKEKSHLEFLVKSRSKLLKKWYIPSGAISYIDDCILTSSIMLQHFHQRIEEYTNYANS